MQRNKTIKRVQSSELGLLVWFVSYINVRKYDTNSGNMTFLSAKSKEINYSTVFLGYSGIPPAR